MHYNELQHSGVKGMKWGQRLYQHKDGSLTPLGRVRYGTSKDFRAKVKRQVAAKKARDAKEAKKKADEEAKVAAEKRAKDVAAGKIPAKKMTDQELQYRLQRVNAEKQYQDAMLATNTGKRIASKLLNEALVPGVIDAGKSLISSTLKKYGGDALGLDKKEKSAHEQLKEQWEASKWKKEILSNNKQSKHLREEAAKDAADKKFVDDYNKKQLAGDKKEPYAKKGKDLTDAKTDTKSKVEKVEGEIIDAREYDSVRSGRTFIAGHLDGPVSSMSSSTVSAGQSAANRYLETSGGWLLEDLSGR